MVAFATCDRSWKPTLRRSLRPAETAHRDHEMQVTRRRPLWRSLVTRVFCIDEAMAATSNRAPYVNRDAVDRALGAPVGQRFTSGDVKGMPCGISEVVPEYRRENHSSITECRSESGALVSGSAGRPPPSRKSYVRSGAQTPSRSARPRASEVGAKRRTLYGVEHSSTLRNVVGGEVCARSEARADPYGDIGEETCREQRPDPPADRARDLARRLWSTAARTRRVSSLHTVQTLTESRGVSDPPIGAMGRITRCRGGSLTPRLPLMERISAPTRGTRRRSACQRSRPRCHDHTMACTRVLPGEFGTTVFRRLQQRRIQLTPKVCGPSGSPFGVIRG